jgi:hypothetical protein
MKLRHRSTRLPKRFELQKVYISPSQLKMQHAQSDLDSHRVSDPGVQRRQREIVATVSNSLRRLDSWLTEHEHTGYDPFEGLSSRLRPLTLKSQFLRQCLVQFVRRCPTNIRPLIGIRPSRSSKGMGYLARGYMRWNAVVPDKAIEQKARVCLEWLIEHPSKGYSGYCWGNHFDYQTRSYYAPAGTPTIVWSSLIGLTFVEAFERFRSPEYLTVARSTCDFVIRDLARIPGRAGFCLSYVPTAEVVVHNSNVLGAALLARVFQHTKEEELKRISSSALQFTASYQNSNGSWYYGPTSNMHWIDNWHTAYVLDAYDEYTRGTGDRSFENVCRRGWEFFRANFFLNSGAPKYYHDQLWPVDIQCASQALETLCRFHSWDSDSVELASRVAEWTITHMQNADGHFYYQRRPHWTNKVATLHWGQATMLTGLATLLEALQGSSASVRDL